MWVRLVAELFSDIRERVVAVVLVEGATDGRDVGESVVVVIDCEGDASARDAGLLRDILEGDVAGRAFVQEERRSADKQIRFAVIVDIQCVDVVCLQLWKAVGDILEAWDSDFRKMGARFRRFVFRCCLFGGELDASCEEKGEEKREFCIIHDGTDGMKE